MAYSSGERRWKLYTKSFGLFIQKYVGNNNHSFNIFKLKTEVAKIMLAIETSVYI